MTLFEQGVTGVLSMTHLRLTVTDDEKDNVIFVRRKLVSEPEPEQRYTLPPEAVREIRGIIAGEPRLFSLEDQDAYWVCDGSAESFRFSDGERQISLRCRNVWALLDEPEYRPFCQVLFPVWLRVCQVLLKNGVPQRVLLLPDYMIEALREEPAGEQG